MQSWWDSERSQTSYTNLFLFEDNGAQLGVMSGETKKIPLFQVNITRTT